MNKIVSALLVSILTLMGGANACAPKAPGGDTSGDSAGDTQPRNGCDIPAAVEAEPKVAAPARIKYDIFVELQDADCNTVTMGGEPLNVFTIGSINGQSAQYWDGAEISKNVNSPYHFGAFVDRGPKHDMGIHVSTVLKSWDRIRDSEAAFIHCHINRNMAPMRGLPTDNTSVTSPLNSSGRGAAFCSFSAPGD